MKLTILFVTFAIIACNARPQQQQDAGANPNAATVTKNEFENIGVDGYKFGYELSDGQKRDEEATVTNPESQNGSISIKGSYSYVAPDGQTYSVTYIADENGFQPQAAHIPQA